MRVVFLTEPSINKNRNYPYECAIRSNRYYICT